VVVGLPEIQGVMAGSILSGARLMPGTWSGAYACWGTENREAAVRFILPGPANPHGANVEVKVIDPSSNVYIATAAILALARHGMTSGLPLPDEVTVDPSVLPESERQTRDIRALTREPAEIVTRLHESTLARDLLGDAIIDEVVAVRRYIQGGYTDMPEDARAARFRLAWS
jgi:glutamine synthetase